MYGALKVKLLFLRVTITDCSRVVRLYFPILCVTVWLTNPAQKFRLITESSVTINLTFHNICCEECLMGSSKILSVAYFFVTNYHQKYRTRDHIWSIFLNKMLFIIVCYDSYSDYNVVFSTIHCEPRLYRLIQWSALHLEIDTQIGCVVKSILTINISTLHYPCISFFYRTHR